MNPGVSPMAKPKKKMQHEAFHINGYKNCTTKKDKIKMLCKTKESNKNGFILGSDYVI